MQWTDLSYLITVAAAGSLSGAAQDLGVSISTVARRLDALEHDLELRLTDRRRDGVRLTTHGQQIVALAAGVGMEVAKIERAAAALRSGEATEPVRITATEMVVADILAPALPLLWQRAPKLRVELSTRADIVSLAAREADLAVRMVRPVGDSLVARRLPLIRLGLYASRSYLAGRDPAALAVRDERLLLDDESYGRIPELRWMEEAGLAARLRTGSTRALLRTAVAGAGIALLPEAFAKHESVLIAVPPPSPIPPRTPWIVMHRDLKKAAPIRAAADWIEAAFRIAFGK